MPLGSNAAEELATLAIRSTTRRKLIAPTVELAAGVKGAEKAGMFAPKIQEYLKNTVSNNNGQSTIIYMDPTVVRQELGIAKEANDPLQTMLYQRQIKNNQIDKALNVQADTTPDGALSFTGIDNPDLLRTLEGQGPVPIVVNFKGGIPERVPTFTAQNNLAIEYPHLNAGASAGSVVPPNAIKTPADLAHINNAPYIAEAAPGTREYAYRSNDILNRDVQSTIPGIVYVNEARANAFGPMAQKAFALANKLQQAGKSTKEIWQATTGLFRQSGDTRFSGISTGFPDRQPRLEHILPDFALNSQGVKHLGWQKQPNDTMKLMDALDIGQGDLINAAPELKSFSFGLDVYDDGVNVASMDPQAREILMGKAAKNDPAGFPDGPWKPGEGTDRQRFFGTVLLHEFNHAIDSMMRFARGGSWTEVAPERFRDALQSVTETADQLANTHKGRVADILKKNGFSSKGLDTQTAQDLMTANSDILPEWLVSGKDSPIKDYESMQAAYERVLSTIASDKKLVSLKTTANDVETLLKIRDSAMERYKSIYGEESANLAVYRTSVYPDVEALRQMEPSAQMAGRNKQRLRIDPSKPPEYIDPNTMSHIVDERFNHIKARMKQASAPKITRQEGKFLGNVFREER